MSQELPAGKKDVQEMADDSQQKDLGSTHAPSEAGDRTHGPNYDSDGDPEGPQNLRGQSSSSIPKANTAQLGNLHKRRASASPEKFNLGAFQPLPLKNPAPPDALPPLKKMRLDDSNDDDEESPMNTAILPGSSMSQSGEHFNGVLADLGKESAVVPPPIITTPPGTAKTVRSQLSAQNRSTAPKPRIFNIFNAFLRRPELLIHLVSCLNLPSLISLYAISKAFHFFFNKNQTAFILASVRTWAPKADVIFPWRCYRSLCVKDPYQRPSKIGVNNGGPLNTQGDQFRDVPTLRWLQMVVWRQGVCQDMLIQLAVKGLLCPPGTLDAMRRMWLIFDMPLNDQRRLLIQNRHYFTNKTLDLITCFLLKVDMHFTDPIPPAFPANHPDQRRFPNNLAGSLVSGVTLRKTLLAETSLTPLWRVIHGWTWDPRMGQFAMTRVDILRLWVRHNYTPAADLPDDVKHESVIGVPWWKVGTAGLERTGFATGEVNGQRRSWINPHILGPKSDPSPFRRAQFLKLHELKYPGKRPIHVAGEQPRRRLMRPDELVLIETVRRDTQPHTKWVEMMLYGFCDDLGRQIPLRSEAMYLRLSKGLPAWPEAEMEALKEKYAKELELIEAKVREQFSAFSGSDQGKAGAGKTSNQSEQADLGVQMEAAPEKES